MDNIFKCQRCERVFKRKWDMKRHLSRKNPCMAKTENIPENGIKHSKIFQNIPKMKLKRPRNLRKRLITDLYVNIVKELMDKSII